jgi:hypothetical protein
MRMRVANWIAILGYTAFFALRTTAEEPPAPKPEKSWAFRTPTRPTPPAVQNAAWVRTPLDRFVVAKLEEAGLKPAAEADRATLIRRLSFDLIGLPPTPEEVEAFVNDRAPDAYERLVDRLLASPRHGERWALFWLDLVRFAESDGFKSDDPRPAAWRYRDYVIRSFNRDRPYDRFLREQLAGDELYPEDADALIATGFHRHYPDEYNAVDLEKRRQDILNDMTDTTGQVVLGLTLGCARCHDHKFDPIAQTDYYRIQAFFAAFRPAEMPVGNHAEVERYQRQLHAWEEKTADVRRRMAELEAPFKEQFLTKRKARFPKEYQEMYELPAEKRTPLQEQIAAMVAKQVEIGGDDVAKSMKPEVRQQWKELGKQMAEFAREKPRLGTAMTMTDVGSMAPPTFLLKRGDWRQPGQEIAPGYLSAIDDREAAIPASPNSRTTGRRAALAQWLTRPENPLTARVMVNRLWQHHFGKGLVATPSDFGAQGDPPSHPELLDWLAATFVEQGWSLKAMHRLLVMSATYRQSSSHPEASVGSDPENRLWWRMERRRLEGETLRDALLAVSGLLNLKEGGPSVYPELPGELGGMKKSTAWPVSPDSEARNRRSVYVFVKRNQRYPLFSVFDAPDSNETCARRHLSTSAPQALALLNDRTSLEQARAFAGRVLREAGSAPDKVAERAFRLALGRSPDAGERQAIRTFLDREVPQLRERLAGKHPPPAPVPVPADVDTAYAAAVVDVCHALLNVNEFLYVD